MKWTITDLITNAVYRFQTNPNQMTPITGRKSTTSVPGSNGPLVLSTQPGVSEFSFSGVLYSQDQYDDLAELVERRHPYRITDHLGRQFDVLLTRFEPEDRRPKPGAIWKHNYKMTGTLVWRAP